MIFVFGAFLLAIALTFSGFAFSPTAHAAEGKQGRVSSAAAVTCPPTISQGSKGWNVKALQSSLNSLYRNFNDSRWFDNSPKDFRPFSQDHSKPLAVDGDYGPLTFNAVWDYQSWNGLKVDGIVGPQTWGSLGFCV